VLRLQVDWPQVEAVERQHEQANHEENHDGKHKLRLLVCLNGAVELRPINSPVQQVDGIAAIFETLIDVGEAGEEDVCIGDVGECEPLLNSLHVSVYIFEDRLRVAEVGVGLCGIMIKLLDVFVEQLARGGIGGVLDGPEREVVDEVDDLSHLPYFLQN
jgi:hypothetical protein